MTNFLGLRADEKTAFFIDGANLMGSLPWWLKSWMLRYYIWHWERVGDLGVLMASAARKRLGVLAEASHKLLISFESSKEISVWRCDFIHVYASGLSRR